jgi:Glycine cleavage system T protein (aminomethyltransferase)
VGAAVVGYVTSLTWGYSLGKVIGLAHVQSSSAIDGNEVSLVWPTEDGDYMMDARLTDLPFRKHVRAIPDSETAVVDKRLRQGT